MPRMIARCGFKCHACLAFVGVNKTTENQAKAAKAWKKDYDLAVPAADIRYNGCLSKDRGGYRFPEPHCYFSACAQDRGLDNCAGCPEYPCMKLERRMRKCDAVLDRFRGRIPERDFKGCLAPYDPRFTLDRLRKG